MDNEIAIKVIGSILQDKFLLLNAIRNGLDKELFENREEQILVDYLLKTYAKKNEIADPDLIKTELEEKGIYTIKLGELISKAKLVKPISFELLVEYIDVLKRRKSEEKLMHLGKRIEEYINTKGHKEDLTEFTGELINELHDIMRKRVKKQLSPLRTQLIMFSSEVETRKSDENLILGYSLEPFHFLNETLSGARRGFYYALAGAPRRGKTNFMLRIASYIASNEHIPVLYYSWEQTSRVLFLRILSQETLIPPFILETSNIMNDPELSARFEQGYANTENYMNYLYLIEGKREDTISRIRSHAFAVMQEAGTDKVAIFIDYLQKVPTPIIYQDLSQQVDEVSGGLANLSLELNCPIFAISSFDKEGCRLDSRGSKVRPTMFYCTGGGDIEYDADVVTVLAKDFNDTDTLMEKIENAAKEGRIDPEQIPHFEILNLYVDKNRDTVQGGNIIIQYLFLIEDNNIVEIGYKNIEEEYTYAKISQIFEWMLENGYLVNMRGKSDEKESDEE